MCLILKVLQTNLKCRKGTVKTRRGCFVFFIDRYRYPVGTGIHIYRYSLVSTPKRPAPKHFFYTAGNQIKSNYPTIHKFNWTRDNVTMFSGHQVVSYLLVIGCSYSIYQTKILYCFVLFLAPVLLLYYAVALSLSYKIVSSAKHYRQVLNLLRLSSKIPVPSYLLYI